MSTSLRQGYLSSPSHTAAIYHDLVAGGHIDCEVGQKPGKAKSQEKQRVTDLKEGAVQLHSLRTDRLGQTDRWDWLSRCGPGGQPSGLLWLPWGLMDFVCCHRK